MYMIVLHSIIMQNSVTKSCRDTECSTQEYFKVCCTVQKNLRKDGSMVSLHGRLHYWFDRVGIQLLGGGSGPIDSIQRVVFRPTLNVLGMRFGLSHCCVIYDIPGIVRVSSFSFEFFCWWRFWWKFQRRCSRGRWLEATDESRWGRCCRPWLDIDDPFIGKALTQLVGDCCWWWCCRCCCRKEWSARSVHNERSDAHANFNVRFLARARARGGHGLGSSYSKCGWP